MPSAHAALLKPPVAKPIPKEIVTHGDKRIDPYFWLREKTNSEVIAYLEAENRYADTVMQPLEPFRQKLYREILSHLKETDSSAPVRRGEYWYYTRTEEGKNYSIHCRKRGNLQAAEEIILDVNKLAEGFKFFSLGTVLPSDDNYLLAYSTDTNGYRQFTLQIKDLRTGKLLPDKFERVTSVAWGTDNRTLFFVTEDPITKRSDSFFRHVLGNPSTNRLYFEPDELFDIGVSRSRDRSHVFLTAESKLSTEVSMLSAGNPDDSLRVLHPREPDHKYFADHRRGKLYLRTNDKAKNYKIVTTPIDKPGKGNWTDFVPHNPAVKLDDLDIFAEHAVLSERENGLERIRIIRLDNQESHTIELAEPAYTLGVDSNPEFDTPKLRFRYQSMVTPNSSFEYDMNQRSRVLIKKAGGGSRIQRQQLRVGTDFCQSH